MKIFNKKILLIMVLVLGTLYGNIQASEIETTVVKRLNWGIEVWELGTYNYVISIDEEKPVKINRVYGYVTACPQPEYKLGDTVIRQTLLTLCDFSGDNKYHIESDPAILGTTTKSNHSLDRHLLSVNVKQLNDQQVTVPVDITYTEPVLLSDNKLRIHIFNESYRFTNGIGCFVTQDTNDSIDVEIHLLVEYTVEM